MLTYCLLLSKKKKKDGKSHSRAKSCFSHQVSNCFIVEYFIDKCSVSIMPTLNLVSLGIGSFNFMLFLQVTGSSFSELIKCNTEKDVRLEIIEKYP